jgi:glutaredoxin
MFKIYVKPGCPYCAETISTAKYRKINHKIIELKTEKRREEIKKKHKYQTFPQVFFKSNLIGGNQEFQSIVSKCDQMNTLFDSMTPKILKTVVEICCALSTKKNACVLGTICQKKTIKRKKNKK